MSDLPNPHAHKILETALAAICGARADDHGPVISNSRSIRDRWNARLATFDVGLDVTDLGTTRSGTA